MNNTSNNTIGPRRRRALQRRGVAMLLAMCAVATASIVTATYIASRESTPDIGTNVLESMSAKWAGESAGDLAVAALETGLDPADLADPDKFMDGMTLAGATVDVAVTDANGNEPAPDAAEVVVTVSATKGGVTTTSQRVVKRTPPGMPIGDAIDPELGEFSVFATDQLQLESGSAIGPWAISPGFKVGETLKVGLGFTDSTKYSIGSSALTPITKLFVRATASAALKSQVGSARFSGGAVLPVDVPAIRANLPANAPAFRVVLDTTYEGGSRTLSAGYYRDLLLEESATVTLTGVYSFLDLKITESSILRISGDVVVICRDDLEITGYGTVSFADANSKVTFLVADDVIVNNACLGLSSTIARNSSRSASSVTAYTDPRRLRVFSLTPAAGGSADQSFTLQSRALAVGLIFMPRAAVEVQADCVLHGNAVAGRFTMKDRSLFLYDYALNKGFGFTNLTGPLYKGDGSPVDGLVEALASVTEAASDLLGLTAFLKTVTTKPEPPEDEPTPRTQNAAKDYKWPSLARAIESTAEGSGSSKGLLIDNVLAEVPAEDK